MRVRAKQSLVFVWLLLAGLVLPGNAALAKTAAEIEAAVDAAVQRFHAQVKGSREILAAGKGILVFPEVIKVGIGIGGEYGEGALRVGGQTVAYYSIASGSIGLQLGAQKRDVILVFLQRQALEDFRASSGWKAGVDGSVAAIDVGAGGSVDTAKISEPIIGFMVGQKGLMFNLNLEGTKITRIDR